MKSRHRHPALGPDDAFLPNAIALVRVHIAKSVDASARLVPNRAACMSAQSGELTPAEIWSLAEAFVAGQTWSNKDEVLATLRKHLKVRVCDGRMLTLEQAQTFLSSDQPYAGG